MTLVERFHVDGEPRDAELTDLDGDGWNDTIIAIRDADKIQAYRNVQGSLVLSSEAPVGRSPREIALADFNNDGCDDFVVVNRDSFDVSILLGCGADAVGFQKLDQTYPVDGEVAGLLLADLNHDTRADVLQLHRASSEVSVRLSGTNGQLSLPVIFPTGNQPNSFETADVNGDGHLDVLTANLGHESLPGTISVLLGNGLGSLNPYTSVPIPAHTNQPDARLLAVKAADFDGDGRADLVAGFADTRIAFFRGNGNGTFAASPAYSNGLPEFAFAARQFATGDFDQDGDIDLAGVSFFGELAIISNVTGLMSQTNLAPVMYSARELDSHLWYRARELRTQDVNNDNDPDLVVGLDAGVAIYYGRQGAEFERGQFHAGPGVPVQNTLPDADFSVSGFAFGDYDTDGDADLAVSCFADGCLSILTRDGSEAIFQEAVKVRVPSSEFVAAGDIDGDGQSDLAGSGRTALWIALSGHVPSIRPSEPLQFQRTRATRPVINEVMSSNQGTLVGDAGDRYPDWVELYNPWVTELNLGGWRLEVTEPGGEINSFTFPAGQVIAGNGRKLVLCANNAGPGLIATGYRLPDGGATVRLIAPDNQVSDTVTYPRQRADIAYARYSDGVIAFTSTMMATPGSPNLYTGAIPPALRFRGFDTVNFTANVPLRLFAEADDDSAVLGVSLSWRRVDILNDPWHRVLFYDDGRHQDGAVADGLFSGVLESGLPDGAALQFYLEASDANNKTTYLPESPAEAEDSGGSRLYVLAFGQSRAPLEITEVVSDNTTVYEDEAMGTPDYVEIANVSGEPVPLTDYALSDQTLDPDKRFLFPPLVLEPGQTILVLCDDNPSQGPTHAKFKLDNDGDRVYLQQRTVAGAYVTVDAVEVPALATNQSYSRVGARGPWEILPATPRACNISDHRLRYRMRTGESRREFVLVYPVSKGVVYSVESGPTANGPWTMSATGMGTEIAGTLVHPIQAGSRFFRVRSGGQIIP
jgi:hypothetical protein